MPKRSDLLATYRAKRDFSVTSEPAPEAKAHKVTGELPLFMVHKHDATRLHYDLRLEMEGVLASWAIPKGPSYDPGLKRLAVQTEDHPLEYGNFEGRIPDGEYGAGDSIIWDRGSYDTVPPGQASPQRKKGHLAIELHGEKLTGRWHLVRTRPQGGKDQWLCFKAKDGTERSGYDVVAERPESVLSGRRVTRGPVRRKAFDRIHLGPEALIKKVWPPMRATLSSPDEAPADEFLYEVKYDGYRALAALSADKLAFLTRNALDLSGRFPTLARALSRLHVAEAVIDGEVVSVDPKGVSRFQRLGEEGLEERFVAFDLLWLDGEDLRARPLEERRELLQSVLANVPLPIDISEVVRADSADEAMGVAEEHGWEGLVAKRKGSPYVGARSSDWLKLKLSAAQEMAIVGYTPISNGKREIGALLVGVFDEKNVLRYAGKVGTGFSSKLRKQLFKELAKDRIEEPEAAGAPRMRDARWVRPRLVAQIAFTEWTADGKLRHPSFQGLRLDKEPEECVREKPRRAQAAQRQKGTHPVKRKLAARTARAPRTAAEDEPAVHVTHPERVLFPKSRITKGEVFEYYRDVAEVMVPALAGRPLALEQFPQGIDKPGFFRQQVQHAPPWVSLASVEHGARTLRHIVVDRAETVEWLANQSALTLHMWHSRISSLGMPDWVLFDLDPGDGGWESAITAANALRGLLEEIGIASVPKTSGKRGLHVLVPLAPGHTYADSLAFAEAITGTIEKGLPQLATTERAISKRRGRLYLDAQQNGRGKTVVAPYVIRAVEGAPVSCPLRWSEVGLKLDPKALNIPAMRKRLDSLGDLFAPTLHTGQRLPRF